MTFPGDSGTGLAPAAAHQSTGHVSTSGLVSRGVPLTQRVAAVGRSLASQGTAFHGKEARLECTLLGRWDAGHQEAWRVLTDLSPQAAEVCWYGLRAWIEPGFKRLKRGGWPYGHTPVWTIPRAQRRWLAIALATGWLLSVGGEAEAALPVATLPTVPGAARRQNNGWRLVGIFRQGWNLMIAALLGHQMIPVAHAVPEPWPTLPQNQCSIKTYTCKGSLPPCRRIYGQSPPPIMRIQS